MTATILLSAFLLLFRYWYEQGKEKNNGLRPDDLRENKI